MTDSTNPRVMADNIKKLVAGNISQDAELEALGDKIEALGSYSTTEVNTEMKYGNDTIYRKMFYEELPNATTKNVQHGIENLKNVIRLTGTLQAVVQVSDGKDVTGTGYPSLAYSPSLIKITTDTNMTGKYVLITFEYTKADPSSLTSPAPDTRALEEPEPEPIEEKK